MKEVKVAVRHGKWNGIYKTYQFTDMDCPTLTNRLVAVVGDWIADDKGLVAQIIRLSDKPYKKFHKVVCLTCFGSDHLRFIFREGRVVVPALEFARPRLTFSTPTKCLTLTAINRLFLQMVAETGNIYTAYQFVHKKPNVTPAHARQLFRALMSTDDGRSYFREMMSDEVRKRGLDKEDYYLDKLEDAVKGGIKNDLHLRILKMLGSAGGNPEVIKMLAEDIDAGVFTPSFPNDGRIEKAEEVKELEENNERLKT